MTTWDESANWRVSADIIPGAHITYVRDATGAILRRDEKHAGLWHVHEHADGTPGPTKSLPLPWLAAAVAPWRPVRPA